MLKRILIAALALALVVGGVWLTTGFVKAQTGGTGTSTTTTGPTRPFDQFLADELGITLERLQEARQKAAQRALDQALADGKITQEQYDHAKAMQALRAYIDPRAVLAEALGVSVDELDSKTLREWMDEKGLDRAALQSAIETVLKAKLEQAVKDGVITQEQLDNLEDDFFMRGLMRGLMGGRGRGGLGGPGFPGRGGMMGPGGGMRGGMGPGDCFQGAPLGGDGL